MNEVFVLQIRFSGEEDEVFLFRELYGAQLKVFDFFGELAPTPIYQESLDDLEERYFAQDRGYFKIYRTRIQ